MNKPISHSTSPARESGATPSGAASNKAWTVKTAVRVSKGVLDIIDKLGNWPASALARSATLSNILGNALSPERINELLASSKLSSSITALLAFHGRFLSDDADPSSLPEDLKIIYNQLASSFAKCVLDEMHRNEKAHFVTKGSEAEIFRFHSDSGDFIIAKRRYDSKSPLGTDKEISLQVAARRIAKKFDGVSVPKIFSRIPDAENGCEYVVMECVKGKTLWNLTLETLANIEQAGQSSLNVSNEANPIRRFFEERESFALKFDNDTEAEKDMVERYRAYGEKIGSKYDLWQSVIDPMTRQVTYPYLTPFLEADIAKTQFFSAELIAHVASKLRPFLTELHRNGIYHRDLNVRNLMLWEDGLIHVIDFWKGLKSHANDEAAYDTQEGKYDNDFSILELMRNYGPKRETEADKIRKAVTESKNGISFERISKAAAQMGLDANSVADSVGRISQKFWAKYFASLFGQYVNGTAERTNPNTFIRPNPRKAEMVKTSEAGKRQLLAHLLLADPSEVNQALEYFDSVRNSLDSSKDAPVFWSEIKDERARKYLPIFETAILSVLE